MVIFEAATLLLFQNKPIAQVYPKLCCLLFKKHMQRLVQIASVQARQPPVITCLDWAVDHVCPYRRPFLKHIFLQITREFIIHFFGRWREKGVFINTCRDPPSFSCRPRLRWSPTLDLFFVLIQIPLPPKRSSTHVTNERFRPASALVSLQVGAARKSTAAFCTFMHREWMNIER